MHSAWSLTIHQKLYSGKVFFARGKSDVVKFKLYPVFSRLETIAEANKQRVILEAQAEAEAVAIRGEAEAFAIEAKAKAEAEQMAKKADAWGEYEEAAKIEMVLKAMPQIAAEVAAPLAK